VLCDLPATASRQGSKQDAALHEAKIDFVVVLHRAILLPQHDLIQVDSHTQTHTHNLIE